MKKIIVAQITLMVFAGMFLVFSEAQAEYTLMRSLPGFGGGEVRDYVPVVIRLGIALAALLAVVMIVVAGFMYITAAGSPGKTEKAKTIILDAIIGLLIAIGYWLILQAINPAILSGNIPSLESAPGGHVDAVGGGGTTGSVGGGGGFSPEGYADIYESGEAPTPNPDSDFDTANLNLPDYTAGDYDGGTELNTNMWGISGEECETSADCGGSYACQNGSCVEVPGAH